MNWLDGCILLGAGIALYTLYTKEEAKIENLKFFINQLLDKQKELKDKIAELEKSNKRKK